MLKIDYTNDLLHEGKSPILTFLKDLPFEPTFSKKSHPGELRVIGAKRELRVIGAKRELRVIGANREWHVCNKYMIEHL